jgi:hypothetical protein
VKKVNPYESPASEETKPIEKPLPWGSVANAGASVGMCGTVLFSILSAITFAPRKKDEIDWVQVAFYFTEAMIVTGFLITVIGSVGWVWSKRRSALR